MNTKNRIKKVEQVIGMDNSRKEITVSWDTEPMTDEDIREWKRQNPGVQLVVIEWTTDDHLITRRY